MANKTIILTIDGGGIKGIIPAYILGQIESVIGKPCYQIFDIIGGTSTGGIISVALTTPNFSTSSSQPFTAAEILSKYVNDGASIFFPQESILPIYADYYANDGNGNGIEPFLQSLVGAATTLSAAHKAVTGLQGARVKQMFTTGYIINSGTGGTVTNPVQGADYGPCLFNWADAVNDSQVDYCAWEAGRATSAAPVYFPVASVGGGTSPNSAANPLWVVDGGVMSNNPAIWGFSEAFRQSLATNISDIVIVALGTGVYAGSNGVGISTNASDITAADGNWNEGAWIGEPMYDLEGYENDRGTLVDVILGAVPLVADSQLQGLVNAGLQYIRLEPQLTQGQSVMDNIDPSNIADLQQVAEKYISSSGDGYKDFNTVIRLLQASM